MCLLGKVGKVPLGSWDLSCSTHDLLFLAMVRLIWWMLHDMMWSNLFRFTFDHPKEEWCPGSLYENSTTFLLIFSLMSMNCVVLCHFLSAGMWHRLLSALEISCCKWQKNLDVLKSDEVLPLLDAWCYPELLYQIQLIIQQNKFAIICLGVHNKWMWQSNYVMICTDFEIKHEKRQTWRFAWSNQIRIMSF